MKFIVGTILTIWSMSTGADAWSPSPRLGQSPTFLCSSISTETSTASVKKDTIKDTTYKSTVPGLTEDTKFDCDESVQFWKYYAPVDSEHVPARIQEILTRHVINGNTQSRSYWISHVIRSGYFTANAAIGVLAHTVHERFWRQSNQVVPFLQSNVNLPNLYANRLMEAFYAYEQNWKWIKDGTLNYPWDVMIGQGANPDTFRWQVDHKQSNPFFVWSETTKLVQESIGVFGKRVRYQGKPTGVWMNQNVPSLSEVSYPSYYLNDFHYQTDGWLSSNSAKAYEVSTETLFLGRQDAMQRQTLVPLKKYFTGQGNQTSLSNLLEVACGTGRLATFARDNFPTTNMTLVDLSPFYLEKARDNIQYWQSYRGSTAIKIATGEEKEAPDNTQFVQANAEALPFPDNSFDAVTAVYLFHELPHQARVRAASELARVCQPGGMVVVTDSLQRGDRPSMDAALHNFEKLNEPHYASYIEEDLSALFERHGLECHQKYVNSVTKTLSFVKRA